MTRPSSLRPLYISSRLRLAIAVASVVFVLDQITKFLAVKHLTNAMDGADSFSAQLAAFLGARHPVRGDRSVVLENFWSYVYAENPGAAWSFLHDAPDYFRTPFFLVVSLAAMVFIVVYYRKTTRSQWLLRLALALVLGGALGNFFDRVRLGYVIDFIDWHWYSRYTWPTFNVADSAITVGVVIMAADMLFHKPRVGASNKTQTTSS